MSNCVEIGRIHACDLYFDWSMQGVGFGQLEVELDVATGKLLLDNECMSRERVATILHALADHITATSKMDCEHPNDVTVVAGKDVRL